MGRITVVNLTDAPIKSAISIAGVTYSGINGILPNVYYEHNALKGSAYTVKVGWYVTGVTEDFPASDLSQIGWFVGGAVLTLAAIAATAVSAGALAAPAGALIAALGAATAVETTAGALAAAGAAVATFVEAAGIGSLTGLGIGALSTLCTSFLTGGTVIYNAIRDLPVTTVDEYIWGGSYDTIGFSGQIPIKLASGPAAVGLDDDKAKNRPLTYEKLTEKNFDKMRRIGQLYQVTHMREDYTLCGKTYKAGEYSDFTQGVIRTSLRAAGGKENMVDHHGAKLDISRTYKIMLVAQGSSVENDSESTKRSSLLKAGADGDDYRVYLSHEKSEEVTNEYSCCYWQLIPTREHGGGWLLVDRRYVRFLHTGGSDGVYQFNSNEIGGISIEDGWATNVKKTQMVWQLEKGVTEGSIEIWREVDGKKWYVSAGTDGNYPIYSRTSEGVNLYQSWSLVAVD